MIELIPAIDIIGGQCVRLSQGDYQRVRQYNADPADVARLLQDHGLRRLHVVDLDGARQQHVVNARSLEAIARATDMVIDFGGGVKTDHDLATAFNCGASMVTGGSIAVKDPATFERWLAEHGPEKIILGADVKDGRVAVSGWTESSQEQLDPFLQRYREKGVTQVICTDIGRDGMLQGPAVQLYAHLLATHPQLRVTASGGVGNAGHLHQLDEAGVPAVIVGKALLEGLITWDEVEVFTGLK